MNYQEMLRHLTESYLKSLISEASGSLSADFDSFAPFGELGIDSFYVLKIIRKLEADFGTLPKSLLFENFNINDLANYFVSKHEQTLSAKFANRLNGSHGFAHADDRQPQEAEARDEQSQKTSRMNSSAGKAAPIRILEKEARRHPELQELVNTLFERHKIEGSVSRGTRKIAPNLFIGSARRGYFHYGRSQNMILVYGYTGPRDYLPTLLEEIYGYCEAKKFQLNIFSDEEIPAVAGVSFSATPFGALQRILNLKEFNLDGGTMRRLRYQISKFQKSGTCKTEEYRCGTNPATDNDIAKVIDRWCAAKTMVNPLVQVFKSEVLAGTVSHEHRIFLTYLDDVLQNVILITAMSAEENGYLMDLEFYPPDMPLGGLEFAIVEIIKILAAEGSDVLSLGGTYGCRLSSSTNADPEVDRILDDLHKQKIFNDEGNLQFKNKFRPENKPIYLCRPAGSGTADNVIDIIMMIADPDKMQTSDEENHNFGKGQDIVAGFAAEPAERKSSAEQPLAAPPQAGIEGHTRSTILASFGFNPINIPNDNVEIDLKTDSWAQLQMPFIETQMKYLQAQIQQPVSIDDSLRMVFPFAHFILTASGQEAEHIFFKAWPRKGLVLQNLLFPSTIFHQIDKGFTNKELPNPAIFDLNSAERYKGNMDWATLQAEVARNREGVALVCIEVGNNAAGGSPVSMQHLREVKALLAQYSIPLVLDVTRVVENAGFLIEQEAEYANTNIWTVVRELLSCADAVIGSLTKDFCVNKGGIIATNDTALFQQLQEIVRQEGTGADVIDKKLIALSLQNRKQIEAKVLRRMEGVRLIWQALKAHNIPMVEPAGGHCILVDVKQIEEFKDFKNPVASFVAWMYLNTGIRAAAHSVGMQKHTSMNDLVRLAIPVGLKREQIESITDKLIYAFERKENIPEIVVETSVPQASGTLHTNYKLINYHRVAESSTAETRPKIAAPENYVPATPGTDSAAASFKEKGDPAVSEVIASNRTKASQTSQSAGRKPQRTQDIAIVGMAGRYPKAKNLGELWENLAQGRDCVDDIPADRYEWRVKHGSTEKYRGGFIGDIDRFDSLFFNISPREAEMLDPQERLFLEVAWEAIEDAGYYPEVLGQEDGARKIGVFVGAVWAMYQMLGVEEKHAGNKIVPNSFLWSIANRVSYWMNFSGPSLTVDTACSSSLTAVYLACEAIRAGDCSAAIVGGVNLDLHQAKFDINHAGGALSPDGVCRSFGRGANGYVAGEGVGALFLKPLEQAERDGDNIYGVIKSVAVNHGGKTSGYTVPNPKAQSSVIAAALEKSNINARSIGYIEAHGTGTALGDPIEITGLSNAFGPDDVDNQSCAIGSIKSNIGHLEAAAGVVSISKVLLQMKHHQLTPSLHSSELNEFIEFEKSPFYVVQRLQEWKPKEVDGLRLPLRAGVSSFGAGGANSHVILEDYEAEPAREESTQKHLLIFPLSARSEDQLRETAVRLTKFLQQNRLNLNDLAFTLQIGRKSFEYRLAIVASTKEELLEKLTSFIAGKKAADIATGHAKNAEGVTRLLSRREKEEFVRLLSQGRDPYKICGLWAEGLLADWHGFQPAGSGKRISLPTYPFADKRYWAYKRCSAHHSLQLTASVHPLIDANESTFDRQLFRKSFNERDFFIYDHLVANIPTLPGVAYLELARKAGEMAAGRKVQKIRNIVWVSPISIPNSTPKEVFIELKPSGATVRFEVFSNDEKGNKVLHSQGSLLYATQQDAAAQPEYIHLESVRARCEKVIDGKTAYPLFKSFGLDLGRSFQVLEDVYKNEDEILGVLKLPEFRQGDLESMVLQPSLVDGSLQAGVSAHLGGKAGEMFVPFSIGEVEILHPLQPNCFSYITQAKEDRKGKKENARVAKSNVLIVDETGRILVKIRESTGVPLRELYDKPRQAEDEEGFSKLYYSYGWEKAPLPADNAERPALHSLLLFASGETVRDLYQERLKRRGDNPERIILVQPGENFKDSGNDSFTINPNSKDDFHKLFACLVEKQYGAENICFAWPSGLADLTDQKILQESLERGIYSFLFICQALIKQKSENKVQLLYLYSGAGSETQPHNDAVRGFVNTLRLEHPKLLCKTVEVREEAANQAEIADAVLAELQARVQDATAVRYEAHERYIKKLKAFDLEEPVEPLLTQGIREKGVYLITGGAGGLGLVFAKFLATEYKARLVLTGRTEQLSAEQQATLEALRGSGGEILYLPADISRHEDVRDLITAIKSHFGEIHGIIHAAGVLRDSLIRNKTAEEIGAVIAPKVHGTIHLDEVTKNEPLDFFVTFSSLAAVAGNGGQCDYSFANHFMDAFVEEREIRRTGGARSGKALSFNWSLWADGGMKLDAPTEAYFKKSLGIKPLSTNTGIEAFVRGLSSERSQFAVLEGVQKKVEVAWGLRKEAPAPAASTSSVPSNPAASTSGPEAVSGELFRRLRNELSQLVMEFLKIEPGDMATDKILLDLGFDSIGLTTFANAINEKYQLDITPVLFFDYPSVDEIAKYLSTERASEIHGDPTGTTITSTQKSAKTQEVAPLQETYGLKKGWDPAVLEREVISSQSGGGFSPELRFVNKPIAIVGMAGVMPQSRDVGEFWENLKNTKNMISVIPRDRWRWEDFYGDPLKEPNKSNSKWGGFMDEIDKFDPLFFGISPREAHTMDPQQRIFLETVWKAIEDSGQKVSDLSGTRTGLFVGAATNDYIEVMSSLRVALDAYSASGNSHSVLANRVSFLLNLRGPSAPIDTACSSSLVALHRAIESIHTGSCDMAIVGGVQVMLTPAAYISFSMAGMLADDGKCKTFDKRANGYVRGEGCGAIFLKSLADAEADGNHIYAVIRATAENHGGKVTTLTAPNSAAQTALLIEAYEKAQVDPTTVGYIECHGTGTSLGDPIEIQALSKAFSELYKKRNRAPAQAPHCGLSSVKTNIGHLETAAGIASMLKVLLAIKHQQIPANVHFEELNPYINLKGTPFYVVDKLTPWQAAIGEDGTPIPRRAGVSSFGFGGANAHIVLEEYIPPKRQPLPEAVGPHLIVLSAKNEDRLKAYIRSMQAYLETAKVELVDFAYTLQVGRDEMPDRVAFIASSIEELKQKFAEILGNNETPKGCYRNFVKNKEAKLQESESTGGDSLVQKLIEQRQLSSLAELWVTGTKIDWRLLYSSGQPRRISVPTYPFARERYWITSGETTTTEGRHDHSRGASAFLHPLIQRNVSTLEKQKFASRFSGEEFFLADHVVETQKVLPGVAYLEMARAAGELSGDAKVHVIRNLTWERPFIVSGCDHEVEISLTPVKNEIKFSVETASKETPVVHCTGKLAYSLDNSAPETLDIREIRSRCTEQVLSGQELYPFLNNAGLKLGKSFQIVQAIYASESESLAILQLPEHLKKDAGEFWLHPALTDGSLHTAIGLMKKNGMDIPLSLPYSVGEVQIFHPLQDLYYGYATWAVDDPRASLNLLKVNIQLLDQNGRVLVRIKDFLSRPLHSIPAKVMSSHGPNQLKGATEAHLQSVVPVWNPVGFDASKSVVVPDQAKILLLGGNQTQMDWLQASYPNAQLLQLAPNSAIEVIEKQLAHCSFDQLIWVAPDAGAAREPEKADKQQIIERQQEGVLTLFRIIKALLHSGYATQKLQWTIITNRTQKVLKDESVHPTHAAVAGLVGSLAKESPQWDLRLLDVDLLASVSAQECLSMPWDKQGNGLAHRGGEWYQQGLVPMTASQGQPIYRKNGVYVVIGGAGGLGEVWTRFMLENYQASVVWIGRRPYDSTIETKINALTRFGQAPLYIQADATDAVSLEQARETILKTYSAIHGVVHSAIVLRDQSIATMEESGFKASLSAKVDISVNMDRVFGGEELDFMLFFSSIISFFKTPGQANYAAGSTFKDSFAQKMQEEHSYPIKVMNWGYWGTVGAAADDFHRQAMAKIGIGSIEPEEGMAALAALMNSDISQAALMKSLGKQATFGLSLSEAITHHQQNINTSIAPQRATSKKARDSAESGNKQTAKSSLGPVEMPDQTSIVHIQQVVTQKLSEALRMSAATIQNDAPFADYGVDSIVGVNLVRTINEALEIEIEPTKLFEYSTVDQLTQYIWSQWQDQVSERLGRGRPNLLSVIQASEDLPDKADVVSTYRFISKDSGLKADKAFSPDEGILSQSISIEPIAILGMSGRFAESESLDEFWKNLKDGKDLVKKVSRWSPADCVIGEPAANEYCSHGSFIDSADRFDAPFFRISALEAVYMDPQQRLFLEESWKALEDAGYAGKGIQEKQCGVYVGCGTSNYDHLFEKEPPPQAWWGNSQSVAPARIAYYLNLQGPAITVDTACSSSLVAIHLACQGLWSRETEMALAGGVYVEATPGFHQVANRAGMLSRDGKCYSFDARANGFVPGEGVGVVVLKRLKDALRDGDHVYAVIIGSGINQNGSSNGLVAPNARAQERLERAVYERANINPETIQVVEAHGTATGVGDSIEYGAISRAFRNYTDKKQFCAIGSVKTNIGHTATAAGVASVLKLVLALKHRQVPPSLHFDKGNPAIDFASSPFYVNTDLEEWRVEDNQRRRGAVSSFGFSGTNAHMVIEEPPAVTRSKEELPAYLVVLSARTSEQLKQQADNLLAYVKGIPDVSLNHLSFTLFTGRMHFGHRLSCLTRNQEELIRLLEQWTETGTASQIYTSEIQEGKVREQATLKKFGNYCIQECRNSTDAATYMEYLATIADLYIQGYSLDFHALFAETSKRIPLPTYPFARERYWIESAVAAGPKQIGLGMAVLHPLLQRNTSILGEISYSSTFNGSELFLVSNGHPGQKMLPAGAYLEMARAAMEMATPKFAQSPVMELEDVAWGHPLPIAAGNEVTVALLTDNNEHIHVEIYSQETEQQTVHFQGQVGFTNQPAPAPLDLNGLQKQMQQGKLEPASIYSALSDRGVHFDPAHEAITAAYREEKQLLVRLCVPAIAGADKKTESEFLLHPSITTGILQAAINLIAGFTQRPDPLLQPQSLKRLRILGACNKELFAWIRLADGTLPSDEIVGLDIDLVDLTGTVCAQMHDLSFQLENASNESGVQATWLFSAEQHSRNGAAVHNSSIAAVEKMELFLKQEAAFQLQKQINDIPIDQSYFDLGLSSLGIAHLVQKTNQLLGETLSPSILFEYRDIQSLAAYLAGIYSDKIEAITVTRQQRAQVTPVSQAIHTATLQPRPRKKYALAMLSPSFDEPVETGTTDAEMNAEQVLEKVLWQEAFSDNNYEKVAF